MNKIQQRPFQSILATPINDFLIAKRALGKHFVSEEKMLRLLDKYLVERLIRNLQSITPDLIESFLTSRPRKTAKSYNHLLSVLRRLFDWLMLHKVITKSPVQVRPRRTTAHKMPFIFDVAQMQRLLGAAALLPSRPTAPDRGVTYRMILALLYALGLRVSEVSRLQIQDVDFQHNLLVIRQTKFSKTRLVPFGPRLGKALQDYLQQQTERYGKLSLEQPVFSFSRKRSRPICTTTISWTFHQLITQIDLYIPPGVSPPHLHCLRHSFAVGTLLHWYRTGINPARRLIHLSTFLGHVSPGSTAVYLTITMDLLQSANKRFEQFATPIFMEVKS